MLNHFNQKRETRAEQATSCALLFYITVAEMSHILQPQFALRSLTDQQITGMRQFTIIQFKP